MDALDTVGKLLHYGDWCYLYKIPCEDLGEDELFGCGDKRKCKWHARNYRVER